MEQEQYKYKAIQSNTQGSQKTEKMAHKFSQLQFALLVSSIFVVAAPGFLDQRADLRPGDSGKTLYRAASLLYAVYAATLFSAFLVVHRWKYWQHPWGAVAAAAGAFLAWLFALQAASSACKARLGARLKRCGWQIIGFTKPHTSSTNKPSIRAALKDFHPRHWLPFYQPWVLYKQGEITRTEMATAMFASTALVALAACFAAEKLPLATYAAPLLGIFTCMAASLDTDEVRMKKLELTLADICWQKKVASFFGLVVAGCFAGIGIILVQLVGQAHQDAPYTCIRVPPLLENSRWLAAASLCCLPFFVLHLYHEFMRGRALRAAGVQRTPNRLFRQKTAHSQDLQRVISSTPQQTLEKQLIGLLGSLCAVFTCWHLHQHIPRVEILAIALYLIFYPLRKMLWFIMFQNIQPFWKNRHAWRAAYLRTRASWLLEWMMAALAPAPLLRFVSFRASPDTLERAGANASLMLAIFLLLPLALRLGQKWQKIRARPPITCCHE